MTNKQLPLFEEEDWDEWDEIEWDDDEDVIEADPCCENPEICEACQ